MKYASCLNFLSTQSRAISWAAKKWKAFPVPKKIHIHTSVSSFKVHTRITARTTTTVSTMWMRIFWPLWAAWAACNIMHLIAHEIARLWVLRKFRQIRMFHGWLYLSLQILLAKMPCTILIGSSYWFMTEHAPQPVLIRHVANCLQSKATSSWSHR